MVLWLYEKSCRVRCPVFLKITSMQAFPFTCMLVCMFMEQQKRSGTGHLINARQGVPHGLSHLSASDQRLGLFLCRQLFYLA